MNETIIDYFEMKLLKTPKRVMQSDRSIKEIYNQPERLNPEDDNYVCPDPIRSYKAKIIICDSPNSENK